MLRRDLVLTLLLPMVPSIGRFGLCSPSLAQSPQENESPRADRQSALQVELDRTCRDNKLPAMWAGKFAVDQQPLICASGVRKLGQEERAEPLDVVHLGSCTKAMTAVLIGQLCSEDKLALDRKLKDVFKNEETLIQSAWGEVTVQELLQHRSGAPANLDFHAFDRAHPESVVDARRELLRKLAVRRRPKRLSFEYSNVGYIVLGHVIEAIENKPWEDVITERLFKPLDMPSASFGPVGLPDTLPATASPLPGRAWGHAEPASLAGIAQQLFGGNSPPKLEPMQIDNARCLGPAGRVHMNLQDWSKFVINFVKPEGHRILKVEAEIWRNLLEPNSESQGESRYAGGWIMIVNPKLADGLFHNGSNTTWYCYAFAVPSEASCVLVATNVFNESARRECDAIARFMLKRM